MVAKKTAKKTAEPSAKTPDAGGAPASAGVSAASAAPAAEKAPAKKAAAKKAPAARKTAARKTAPARKAAAKRTGTAAKKAPAPARAAKTAPAAEAARRPGPVTPADLLVRPGEDPWTAAEVDEVRAGLRDEAERLRVEIRQSEDAVSGLMRDSGDGAGDDQADVGTKNISREHEMALADNAREMLRQTERALGRLDDGTYGRCENCGRPIGKARTQAFPRATLCVECKQRTERH